MTTPIALANFREAFDELASRDGFGSYPNYPELHTGFIRTVDALDRVFGSHDPSTWDQYAELAGAAQRDLKFKKLDGDPASLSASQKREADHLRGVVKDAATRAEQLFNEYIAHRAGELRGEGRTVVRSDGRPFERQAGALDAIGGGATRDTESGPLWVRTNDRKPASLARGQRCADHDVVAEMIANSTKRDGAVIGQHGSFGDMVRAMSTTSGSALVPTVWASNIIDRARNIAAVLKAGAEIVPMDAKTVQIGRLTGDPTAAFRAEGGTITASDPTFDNVTLDAKSMSALVVGSIEWFQDAENVDEVVSNAIAQAFSHQLDLVALYGGIVAGAGTIDLATPPNPRGVLGTLNAVASTSVLGGATDGTAQTAATYYNELVDLVFQPQDFNESPNALIWNSKAARQYAKAYDSTYQPLREPAPLAELTKYTSNQVPSYTQGTMTDRATDVFVGDWSQLLIGQRLDMRIETLTERYAENGQIGIIAHWRGDVGIARPRSFAVYKALQGAL